VSERFFDAVFTAHLDAAVADLEAVIRSKKNQPSGRSPATLGRKLIERGEVYDAVARTYTPGPGFSVLLNAVLADAVSPLRRGRRTAMAEPCPQRCRTVRGWDRVDDVGRAARSTRPRAVDAPVRPGRNTTESNMEGYRYRCIR